MSKFCLLMIVRNEENIIERAFESLKNLFDSYIICDTGSTDNTINVIKNWMNLNNKKGEIINKEWVNFGFNKSYLWEYFWNNNKESKYLVFLDADEVFITDRSNLTSYLTVENVDRLYKELNEEADKSIFYLDTLHGNLIYKRWQICRNNQLYVWKQPVHEYLEASINGNHKKIDWIYNLARKEGNSAKNPKRYETDVQMYLEFLIDNPKDPRATFYLAQSYESVRKEKAIEWYIKRLELEGYIHEKYIACLRLGRLMDKLEDKVKYWILGTTICNERLECYYELMMHFTHKKDFCKAYAFGLMASTSREYIPYYLFTEIDIYDYKFDFDFSVACYYYKDYDKGIELNNRAKIKAPENIQKIITKNMEHLNRETDKVVGKVGKVVDTGKVGKVGQQIFKYKNDTDNMSIIIIDNFYDNPMELREKILNDFKFEVKGNYPGFRTKCLLDKPEFSNIKQRFENIIGKKIVYWPENYNSSFQYVTEEMSSWIHRDETHWSAVIYMTPDAPCNGGTNLYKHKELQVEYAINDDENSSENALLNKDARNYDKWDIVDSVGNKFNRCILFRGKRSHKSGIYFGKNKETARLFQTFFFDT